MQLYNTLIDLLSDVRDKDRHIRFIDGDTDESVVTFGELWARALALLGSLQARGMRQGDELVIFSKSNESFVVAFWAAILGGIVPVPVSVGISDEHRHKLFRILGQLERATLFTEGDLRDRLLELYLSLDAYPEVAESLTRLRAGGQKTAILSNGAPRMLAAAATSAGIDGLLDALLSVDEIGIYKPDARVYQLAVDRLGEPAERICFLSSNAWDACGAAHFGFKVAWINRFDQAPERLPGKPATTIESLADVPPLLGL